MQERQGADFLVDPPDGLLDLVYDASLAEVCAKKLDGNISASITQELEQRNCLRVSLFAR